MHVKMKDITWNGTYLFSDAWGDEEAKMRAAKMIAKERKACVQIELNLEI